jgi:sugar-specific transcriptional regulator TrmB
MSTRKEQRKDEDTTTTTTSPSQVQQEQRQSFNRALDETKDNIRRATDEARRDIPRYVQAVNEYHEQYIQTAKEIADNFLDSQKEIISSLQSALVPQIDAANRAVTSNWTSPRHMTEHYARLVSSFADNTIAATRLVNNTIFANLEAFKSSVQNARDNSKEFSRISVNVAKAFGEASRDTTTRFSY